MENKADELVKIFVVYFIDLDPDTGFVSQMKPVAYMEKEIYAKEFAEYLNKTVEAENREYKYTQL